MNKTPQSHGASVDALIIGAGASGLTCALTAARRGRTVLVLDHGQRPARKVHASGGGRCNFTNLHADASHYICGNAHFTRSALARYTPQDFIELLEVHQIAFEEREEGQMFLKVSAAHLVEAMTGDCASMGVGISLGINIRSIKHGETGFLAETSQGIFNSPRLVIATGGKSWKSLGSTSIGYQLARQFGHHITELRPGLVPLTLKGNTPFKGLDGVAFRATLSTMGHSYAGDVLITHKGLSGPAVLQASSHWRDGEPVLLDLLPGEDALQWLSSHRTSRMELKTLLARRLPRRLAHALAEHLGGTGSMQDYSDREIRRIAEVLASFEITPTGTEGFARAEVTVGGVDTHQVSSKTMESRLKPGLFLIGEVLDVTGELGGYNLHWAWASGHAAGEAI